MNPVNEAVTQRELDRLVDGELSPPEYRELLAKVEAAPDGWRQCALAFLETQALREELPWATRMGADGPIASASVSRAAGQAALFRRVFQLVALAASIVIAFGLGRFMQYDGTFSTPTKRAPVPNVIAQLPGAIPQSVPDAQATPPQVVYVNQWDGQSGSEVPIPVDLTKTFDPSEPWDPDWGLTAYELQRLQDAGHRLETQNHLIPVSLSSGQRVVVPMQEIILRGPPEMPFH